MKNRLLFFVFVLTILSGCSTSFENSPLSADQTNIERRTIDVSDNQQPVILVALSGGGVRASALGWTVLKELSNFSYGNKGKSRRLIDDIALISSASGGSVTAAYFGLYGPDGFDKLDQEFLAQNNMGSLLLDVANPFSWLNLAAVGESRSALVADMFDEKLFHHTTFRDLNQPGKPFIILNTTDMVSGERFSFTPDNFDDICSDLDKFPIAVGVAASAAVPIALSPIALENYSTSACKNKPLPQWIRTQLDDPNAVFSNIEKYKRARYANDLRHGPNIFRNIQYLYLVDGGLADNSGLHSIHDALSSSQGIGELLYHINQGDIKKLVVLVVNARSDAPNPIYQSPDRPDILDMIKSVTSVPIDSVTSAANAQMDELLAEMKAAANYPSNDSEFKGMKVYGVLIDFDQLPATDDKGRPLRDLAKKIPTSWTISQENEDILKQVGPLLLHKNPCFQHLLIDMKIHAPFIEPAFAKTECPL